MDYGGHGANVCGWMVYVGEFRGSMRHGKGV